MPGRTQACENEKTRNFDCREKIEKIVRFLRRKMARTGKQDKKMAGENFNINSTKELRRVLFDKLGIGTKGVRKTEGGVSSTKFSELVKLKDKHPIINEIIVQRELAKLKSTYIDALPSLIQKDGRIRTVFNQTGTVTGRLSSSHPNLQNIPVKGDLGKKVREAFVSEKGFSLVSFDYSQVELRTAAFLSRDKKMAEAFKTGKDIHSLAASEIFNVSFENVTEDMRRKAKIMNFGILYGMGINAISEGLGATRKEAEIYRNEYFKDFSGLADYIRETIDEARTNGFAKTFFGRKRHLEEIYSRNELARREAERMAVNMPIQGTSADIIKIAMARISDILPREKKFRGNVKMLLQIHDELLFEIKDDFLNEAAKVIKNIMESVITPHSSGIPFPVKVSAHKSWG